MITCTQVIQTSPFSTILLVTGSFLMVSKHPHINMSGPFMYFSVTVESNGVLVTKGSGHTSVNYNGVLVTPNP